ncbi:MAG: hypothetical protein HOP29_02465 [Phycisphaerales bacterium]|nr:hypothetical protein [Phycisphaerales bacterium]
MTDAVTKQRRDYWLGEFDSRESRERYHRVIALWEAGDRRLPPPDADGNPGRTGANGHAVTVVEIIHEYWNWAQGYYRPKHCQALIGALALLRKFYGRTAAVEFGPKKLRLLREEMIRGNGADRRPWSRKYINAQIGRIKHLFKWAAAREMAPVSVYESLRTLEPLRRGKCQARETARVLPVPDEMLDAVRPHLTRPVRALVELQLLTGARPGELVELRACDIERKPEAAVWVYKPEHHKNSHLERERTIYFGPKSQEILKEFIVSRAEDAHLFSPKESIAEHRDRRRAARKTALKYGNRIGTNRREVPIREPGDRFTTGSYNHAVRTACARAYPPPAPLARPKGENRAEWVLRLRTGGLMEVLAEWRRTHRFHVHQLRHNCASRLRREYGLEAAQLALGHASALLTDAVYAERDLTRVTEIMRHIG